MEDAFYEYAYPRKTLKYGNFHSNLHNSFGLLKVTGIR